LGKHEQFALLSLCTIKDNTATFVTDNQAIIFRAQKQNTVLLSAIKQVKSLTHIEKVVMLIKTATPQNRRQPHQPRLLRWLGSVFS
jgi:hypothetical protein